MCHDRLLPTQAPFRTHLFLALQSECFDCVENGRKISSAIGNVPVLRCTQTKKEIHPPPPIPILHFFFWFDDDDDDGQVHWVGL